MRIIAKDVCCKMNWEKVIEAIQKNDVDWIQSHHLEFKRFFKKSNLKPMGQLDENALQAHYEARLFKMYVGQEFNGLGVPLNEGAKWIENASKLDGNWGWLLGIGVGGAYFVDYMTPQAADEFFKPQEALIAGSGMPNGMAKKVNDHWEISGSWNFCSGCEQASMFTAVVEKEGKFTALVMDSNEAQIIPTWNTAGMSFTCSHTIKADKAMIGEYQFFDLMEPPRPSGYLLSKYPFMQFAQVCFAPVIAGISFSIFREAKSILQQKRNTWENRQPERVEYIENLIELFFQKYEQCSSSFYEIVEKSWKDLEQNNQIDFNTVENTALNWAAFCYTEVANIIPYLGMTVLEADHPVHRMWQNLQVGFQHSSLRKYK